MTGENVYKTPEDALSETDDFYLSREGFQYSEEMVTTWVHQHVQLPEKGKVLDLCCGDGIWSLGMRNNNPQLELYGIDISAGGVEKAKKLLGTDDKHFFVGDTESDMPFEQGFFNMIFARGPGLYNQHSMDRPEAISVIEYWHTLLSDDGVFYSIFASRPEVMGSYTPMEDSKLPYNRSPRKTDAVDFEGGKYHHTIQSFLAPFWKAQNVDIKRYSFFNNLHVLITKCRASE